MVALVGDFNNMMGQDLEIERLRRQVQAMQDEIEQIRRDIYNPPNDVEQLEVDETQVVARNEPPPAPWYAPRRFNNAMNWMYDVAQGHAILRNFGWAALDATRFVGFVGGVAMAAVKATPAAVAKAKGAAAAVGAIAAANPVGAGVVGVVALAAAEKATRYKDEDGNTRHSCSIM